MAARAAQFLGGAGKRALARRDASAAANLLLRAGELLPEGDVERIELMVPVGQMLAEVGEVERARSLCERRVGGSCRGRPRGALRASRDLGCLDTPHPRARIRRRRTVRGRQPSRAGVASRRRRLRSRAGARPSRLRVGRAQALGGGRAGGGARNRARDPGRQAGVRRGAALVALLAAAAGTTAGRGRNRTLSSAPAARGRRPRRRGHVLRVAGPPRGDARPFRGGARPGRARTGEPDAARTGTAVEEVRPPRSWG